MTLKILKIKYGDFNPCEFLSYSFFRGLFYFDFIFYLETQYLVVALSHHSLIWSNAKCGGVKPGPMMWAQEQRFINNTPEEKKS